VAAGLVALGPARHDHVVLDAPARPRPGGLGVDVRADAAAALAYNSATSATRSRAERSGRDGTARSGAIGRRATRSRLCASRTADSVGFTKRHFCLQTARFRERLDTGV
jgi:hypothetical protein